MKNLIVLIYFLLVFSNEQTIARTHSDILYLNQQTVADSLDRLATPVAGLDSFYKHIAKSLIVNKDYLEKFKRYLPSGQVFVQFTVYKNGAIGDFYIIKGLQDEINEIAVEVVKSYGDWSPAISGGLPIESKVTVPIKFDYSQVGKPKYMPKNKKKKRNNRNRSEP